MKKLGRGDAALAALLLVILLGGAFFFHARAGEACYAEVTVGGELFKRVELTGHRGREVIVVENERGRNLIVVEEESIFVAEADCPDQICVKTGRLSKAGEMAACLPHKLLIEVKRGPLP